MKKLLTLLYIASAGSVCASDPILEVQINSKPVQQALHEELLTPVFDRQLVAERIRLVGDEQPAYEKVLSCLTYSTPSRTSLVKVATIQEGNKRDFRFEHAGGNPLLSHVVVENDGGQVRLHHDVVAKQLLADNTFLAGLRVTTVGGAGKLRLGQVQEFILTVLF